MNTLAAAAKTLNLPLGRRLAKQLLSQSPGEGDARIVCAFQEFLALLRGGDAQAQDALLELAEQYHAACAEPYFLELLQAQDKRGERKRHGVYYTPWPVAQWIVRRVEQLMPAGPLRIVDPACGAGVFLLAAAELAQRRPGSSLLGYDLSAAAVSVAKDLLQDAQTPVRIRQINPLLAGEELRDELLVGGASPPTLVVLGNPPYANFGRLNRGPWIDALLSDYRRGVNEQKFNLTDDFIKFLRWGQHWVDQAGQGVLAMITSRTYLSGLTHRGMRRWLTSSFPRIEIVDLHGDGEADDENVFPIRRGVAIGVFAKVGQAASLPGQLRYASRRGSRKDKLLALEQAETPHRCLALHDPDWLFVPTKRRDAKSADDYLSWPRLDEIFVEFISGVQTKNDELFVDFDQDVLGQRIRRHFAGQIEFDPARLRPYVVGPFDRRWIYYDPALLGRSRWQVMRHIIQAESNAALVFMRQSTSPGAYDHALVVDALASDRAFYSRRGAPFVAPLWRTTENNGGRRSNLSEAWVEQYAERLGHRPSEASLFAYVYALLYSSGYRRDHAAQLRRDFPRIPWPASGDHFSRLAELGQQLADCHLSSATQALPAEVLGDASQLVVARGYPRWRDDVVELNPQTGVRLPDPLAWELHIGGYRVLQRWLKVRRGRTLGQEDLRHLAWLGAVAVETERLAGEITLALPN